jgi:hypothetical protein
MATQEIEKLIVSLEASTKKYENALAKAQGVTKSRLRAMEKEAEDFSSRFDRKLGALGAGLKGFGAGFIGGLGVEQIARAAAGAIKSIADIGESAKKLGLTTDEFQTLKFGAKLAGVEVDALAVAMKKLGINSSDAIHGQGEFGKILEANHISLLNSNGEMKSQVEILGIVADLVANAANEQDGLAIAQAALGKSGTELMVLLEQGAGGVAAAMGDASKAGVQFTAEQIAKANEYDDALDTLIEKISVGLKGAFLEAAAGAQALGGDLYNALAGFDFTNDSFSKVFDAFKKVDKTKDFDFLRRQGQYALTGKGQAKSDPNSFNTIGTSKPTPTIPPNPEAEKAATKAIKDREAAAKKAAEADKRRREQIQGVIADLQFEGGQLKASSLQQQINTALRRADVDATSAQGQQIIALVQANYAYEESQKRQKENTALNAEAEAAINQARIDAADELNQKLLEQQQAQRDGMLALAEIGVSALDSIAIQGEDAADVIANLAKQFASAALQAALLGQGPLAGLFGGGKGILGGLLSGGGVNAGIYHKGGTVGAGGQTRSVSPAIFAKAPRYHSGGIAGMKSGEVPAILQKGETVTPRGASNVQRSNVTFQVINNAGAHVEQRESRGPDGERVLQAIIHKTVDEKMRNQYGLSTLNKRR